MRTLSLTAVCLLASFALGACSEPEGTLLISPDVAPSSDTSVRVDGCVVIEGAPMLEHRVLRGETLTSIALDIYGDADLWREIARANPDRVTADGQVDAGVVLRLPFDGQ